MILDGSTSNIIDDMDVLYVAQSHVLVHVEIWIGRLKH